MPIISPPETSVVREWPKASVLDSWKKWAALRYTHVLLLGAIGLFAFCQQLNLSLFEGTEGLYAHITRDMLRANQFFHLTYLGEHYFYKPPLYFWLLGASTGLFGDNEVALRLPGALFSLGTMALTYQLGKALFSREAGFGAAFVVATTYVFLWYGPRVLLDSSLTFFITLALLAWVRPYFLGSSPWWYVASFLAMALGTMIKGLHAFALPALLIVAFSLVQRDFRIFKERACGIGLALFVAVVASYSLILGDEFAGGAHFDVWRGIVRVFGLSSEAVGQYTGSRPIHWYLSIMWFDFSPWCALIPSSMLLLFSQRPFRRHPREFFVLLWVVGFLVAFSLAQGKREPYLMPIVPGLGLMIGYFYHQVWSSSEPNRAATPLFKFMLGILAVAYAVALFLGPSMLHKRWFVPSSLFPPLYVSLMLGLCGLLLYSLVRTQARLALATVGVLAIGLVGGMGQFVAPAIDAASSARRLNDEIKSFGKSTPRPMVLFLPGRPIDEDVIYYLTREPAIPRLKTEEELLGLAQASGEVVVVTEKRYVTTLSQRVDISVAVLVEFPQPKQKNYYLVSLRAKVKTNGNSGA